MKNRDGIMCSRICVGKRYSYSVREDGIVIKTSRVHYVENKVKAYLKRGKATVKINQREYTLKNLVAEHFVEGYKSGDYVELADGNPFNCSAKNLRLYSQQEHGQRTGYLSRSQKIIANGVEYRSIRQCAKALFVSYQTVLDYLNGNVKHSVLRGVTITRAEDKHLGMLHGKEFANE